MNDDRQPGKGADGPAAPPEVGGAPILYTDTVPVLEPAFVDWLTRHGFTVTRQGTGTYDDYTVHSDDSPVMIETRGDLSVLVVELPWWVRDEWSVELSTSVDFDIAATAIHRAKILADKAIADTP